MAGTTDLQRLVVSLEARLDKYNKEMLKAAQSTDKATRQIEQRFKKTEGVLAGFGRGFVSAFSAGAVINFLRNAIGGLAELGDAAKRAGVKVEDLQAAIFAARQEGGNAESIVAAFSKLNLELGEAASKGNDLGKILKANNISLKSLDGDPLKAMLAISDLMKSAATAQDRAVIGNAAFGKGFKELLPFLIQGSDAIKEQLKNARDLGAVIDSEVIARAKEFDDKLTLITDVTLARLKSNTIKIVDDFVTLAGVAERIIETLSGGKVQAGGIWDKINRVLDAGPVEVGTFVAGLMGLQPVPSGNERASPEGGGFGRIAGDVTKMPVEQTEDQKKATREAMRQAEAVAKVVQNLKFEQEQLSRTARERAIYNELARAGVELDSAHGRVIANLAGKFYDQQEALVEFTGSMDDARDATKGFFGDLISGLREGKKLTDILADAFGNLATKFQNRLLDQFVDQLLGEPGTADTGIMGKALGLVSPVAAAPAGLTSVSRNPFDMQKANVTDWDWTSSRQIGGKGTPIPRPGVSGVISRNPFDVLRSDNSPPGGAGGGVQEQVWNFWKSKGLSDNQVAGIVGNVGGESGFDPNISGDNGNAYGLYQHNGPRMRGLFSASNTRTPNVQQQNEYAYSELMGPEKATWNRLKSAGSAEEATNIFGAGFERPADLSKSIDDRVAIAEASADKFAGAVDSVAQTAQTASTGFAGGFAPALQSVLSVVAGAGGGAGAGMGGFASIASALPSMFLGRAAGGPVSPGRTYLIGEKGPELLRMGGPGHVVPNHQLVMPRTPDVVVPGSSASARQRVEVDIRTHASKSLYSEIDHRVDRGGARTLNTARKNYPDTQARFQKLGTTTR